MTFKDGLETDQSVGTSQIIGIVVGLSVLVIAVTLLITYLVSRDNKGMYNSPSGCKDSMSYVGAS